MQGRNKRAETTNKKKFIKAVKVLQSRKELYEYIKKNILPKLKKQLPFYKFEFDIYCNQYRILITSPEIKDTKTMKCSLFLAVNIIDYKITGNEFYKMLNKNKNIVEILDNRNQNL